MIKGCVLRTAELSCKNAFVPDMQNSKRYNFPETFGENVVPILLNNGTKKDIFKTTNRIPVYNI